MVRRALGRSPIRWLAFQSDMTYGRFLGTEFFMTTEQQREANTKEEDHQQKQLECPYGRRSKRNGMSHLRKPDVEVSYGPSNACELASDHCTEKIIHPRSVCDWIMTLYPVLKNKPMPRKAKEYLQRSLLQGSNGITIGNIVELYKVVNELGICSDEITSLFLRKIAEMREGCVCSNDKESLVEIMVLILNRPNLVEFASQKDIYICMMAIREYIPECSSMLQYNTAELYANLFQMGIVNAKDVQDLGYLLMKHSVDLGKPMTLYDCACSIALLSLLKVYIIAQSGDKSFVCEVKQYLDNTLFVQIEKNINTLTAAQITDVVSFFHETGIQGKQDLIEGCCRRFVRDISQFSLSDMLEFNQKLLNIGYKCENVILQTVCSLPRRTMSITSVEHLINLVCIAKSADMDSEFLRSFITEQLLQLAHKLGRRHCEVLDGLLTPQICGKEGFAAIENINAKYMLNSS